MSQIRPATYEIRIRGRLGPGARAAFEGYELVDVPAETLVRGMLDRLRDYGYELVEVRRVAEF